MTEQEAVKQSAELLRKIIRSIDKKLEYNFIDPTQEGRFSLRLSARGRVGVVSLLTQDLRLALSDDTRRNVVRQKIKSTRDHLLSNYVVDVMGKKMTRMLKAPRVEKTTLSRPFSIAARRDVDKPGDRGSSSHHDVAKKISPSVGRAPTKSSEISPGDMS